MTLAPVEWRTTFRRCLERGSEDSVVLVGVGNPLRRDDAVGLYVVKALRKRYGARPKNHFRILTADTFQEGTISRAARSGARTIIFDAVDCNGPGGRIVCANLGDSRFGFFSTHNVPLRVLPGVREKLDSIWVVGVQPMDTGFGETLTPAVLDSASEIVDYFGEVLEGLPE